MKSEFELIVKQFPRTTKHVHLYFIGDLHIGAKECDMNIALTWREQVLADPVGYVCILGDMINNGIKSSKTNCYEEVLRPREQKEELYKFLKPLAAANRIISWNIGNHEYRSVKEVDSDPSYETACRLGLEDIYRQNGCFIKISLGAAKRDRQYSYNIATVHGASVNKHNKFCYAIEGADLIVSGHTHTKMIDSYSKIKFDPYNKRMVGYTTKRIVIDSMLSYGGYALRGEYTPQRYTGIMYVELSGTEKSVRIVGA